ncbi:6283_t:CDS:2, partial [Cetraspora pellucida]
MQPNRPDHRLLSQSHRDFPVSNQGREAKKENVDSGILERTRKKVGTYFKSSISKKDQDPKKRMFIP